MKQIVQNARTGEVALVDVPAPAPDAGQVLVRNRFSVVSPGTETQALHFGRMSILSKARSRPDLVAQVTRKLREEGPLPTYRAVMSRLDSLAPLGYSCAGVVEAVGSGVHAFAPGDSVACAGAGYANHAEFVSVPANLVARVPEGVSLQHAAFATMGAIALQGLRIANPTLGEIAAVVGLGLIGQLTIQLLRANGCRVLALDVQADRVKTALEQGADWAFESDRLPASWKDAATDGHGVDLAVVTASASTSAPLELAAELCRRKGRISMVGNVPMQLDRRTFYDKELELRMSTSYGPGRYDRVYEEGGHDYPLPYVRWTENRNMGAFLQLVAGSNVRPDKLGPETVDFGEAERVYEELAGGQRRPLALLFAYASEASTEKLVPLAPVARPEKDRIGVAFVGAGNYAKGVLLPALVAQPNVQATCLVTATGNSARRSAERFGFASCGTDPDLVFADPAVDLVFVATRHDSHADLAVRALEAGKAVWLEKPVGLSMEEVERLADAVVRTDGFLTMGYNRRFSPHARAIRRAFSGRMGPLSLHYVVAAGAPPRGTWLLDPREGGGRIIGEACHFVDLATYLVGSPPATVYARHLARDPERDDSLVATLGFPDGSAAVIEYLARSHPQLPKERFEVSADERTARCENFRTTHIAGAGSEEVKSRGQDKGQAAAIVETLSALRSGRPAPFTLFEIVAVSRTTFAMLESAATGREVRIGP